MTLSPEQALDQLARLHDAAVRAQREALARFVSGGAPPSAAERQTFRYPELLLSWHPDGPFKLAAAYSILRFQQHSTLGGSNSYIWDVNSPNVPCNTLTPPSPVVRLVYNHKNPDQLGFGCYNGTVGVWDNRAHKKTGLLVSEIEVSHHEPVVDFIWLSSKGGNEFVTCSTDGKVIWWDYRNLSQPTDSLLVAESAPTGGAPGRSIGATALEYVADYGVS